MQNEPVVSSAACPPADAAEAQAITEQVRAVMREHLHTGVALAQVVRRSIRPECGSPWAWELGGVRPM